jgi:hypothetical protein
MLQRSDVKVEHEQEHEHEETISQQALARHSAGRRIAPRLADRPMWKLFVIIY